MPPFSDSRHGATLSIRVTPRAGRTALAGMAGNQLLVRIAAAPVDDAANDALVELLSRALDVPKRSIQVTTGAHSRNKRITIAGYSSAALDTRLAAALR